MKITISTANTKLGHQIPTVNLPAIKTCRHDAPCAQGNCYATKGRWLYPNVQQSLINNLARYIIDSKAYFDDIIKFLNGGLVSYKYFRWHSSGDIVNDEYFLGMVKVAKKCKRTKFLCFTKKFEIVNDYLRSGGKIPKNLKVVFSAWDKTFTFDNPYNLSVAYVSFRRKEKNPEIPDGIMECVGTCDKCVGCWGLKDGCNVLFHEH